MHSVIFDIVYQITATREIRIMSDYFLGFKTFNPRDFSISDLEKMGVMSFEEKNLGCKVRSIRVKSIS